MVMSRGQRIYQIVIHIILMIVSLSMILPLVLLFMCSITDENTLIVNGYSFIPARFSISAYSYILQNYATIFRAYGITILVTLIGTLGSLILTTMLAFPLSLKELPGRKILMFIVFFTMLFNGGLVPWYLLITNYLHLKDTYWVMILTTLINVYYIILMKNFMKTVPKELIEAAKIDGAGEFYIFFRIVIPLVKPALASIGMFIALGYWNEWRTGMLFLQDKRLFPLQYYLYRLLNSVEFLKNSTMLVSAEISSLSFPSESLKLAMTVIATGPIVCLYPFLQKYFVKGITIGAVKG